MKRRRDNCIEIDRLIDQERKREREIERERERERESKREGERESKREGLSDRGYIIKKEEEA